MNELITLIAFECTQDDDGNIIEVARGTRNVFAAIKSAQRAEHIAAGQQGLKAENCLEIWAVEYGGEKVVSVRGEYYDIYRTFERTDGICELYTARRNTPVYTEGTDNEN